MKVEEYSFLSLLSNIVDNRGKTCPTTDTGIPLIATNCIKNDQLYPTFDKIRFVSDDTYKNWFRGHPEPNDIIFVCKGSPGRVALTPKPVPFCIAQDMVAIRANDSVIDTKFLFALLRSDETQQKIQNMHVGTLIPHFKKGDFKNLYLSIPVSKDIQKKIGKIYFDFSKKIELNNQINQTLEAMAQALFKSWFVDFEPVKAKVEARAAGADAEGVTLAAMEAISGQNAEALAKLAQTDPARYAEMKDTAELFPDALVDSELGEIPAGWEVSCLGNVTSELRRGISPKYTDDGGVMVINQKCIRHHSINFELTRRNNPEKRKITGRTLSIGDVLVNSTGVGTLGRLAQIRRLPENEVVFDSHVTVVRANEKINASYLGAFMITKESYIESSGAGSTGQTELRKDVLKEIPIVIPQKEVLQVFDSFSQPISNQIATNESEALSLASLRDTLLPRLLSGELSVENIELSESTQENHS